MCNSSSSVLVLNRTSPSLLHTFIAYTTQLAIAIQHNGNSFLHKHIRRKRLRASSCYDTVCNSRAFLDSLRMDKTNINALVQSIERSLRLICKNIFSIKQYQFPPKVGLNLFKESRRTSPLCVRRRLRLYIYPRRPEVMVGRDREWRAYR